MASPNKTLVVGFFDLKGSTQLKQTEGHFRGAAASLAFTTLASRVVAQLGGQVVKSLGDGILCTFEDQVVACEAAINIRHGAAEYLELECRGGLAAGIPSTIRYHGVSDIIGDVVDRAARVQSLAIPGQILVDRALADGVRTHLNDGRGMRLSQESYELSARGLGQLQLYELSLEDSWLPAGHLATPFQVLPEGRPSLEQKLRLIDGATEEIIEIGIGLTSFANYFTGQKPEEFRDPIRRCIRRGVSLRCFALDPAYAPGTSWLDEQGNQDYFSEARVARGRLLEEARYCRSQRYLGHFEYHTYQRIPEFWCLGVDVDDPINGRMFFASYMMGVPRSEMPVIQVSAASNSALYWQLHRSVSALREVSTRSSAGRVAGLEKSNESEGT